MTNFYADRFYKDENGNYYTLDYIRNNYGIQPEDAHKHGYKDVKLHARSWDEFTEEMTGKPVRCTYAQIFYPDSNMILCNSIPEAFPEMWEYIENGSDYDEENDEYREIYQYYIIDDMTAQRLKECTDEIIFYIEKLDLHVLGVTHWGTSWEYTGTEFYY